MTTASLPRYGVVVLTQGGRPADLDRALTTLLGQRDVELDVVVVGNGWEPVGLPAGVRAHGLPENLGIPAGRNAGVPLVKGDLLFFLDDDASLPDDRVLSRMAALFAADPELGLVQPRVVDPDGRPAPRRWTPGCVPATPDGSAAMSVWEGAVALTRPAFDFCGGWPAEFWYAHEGVELAWRVWDGGFHVRYDGEIEVNHPAIKPTRHAEFYRLQARNRVWLARRNLPFPVAPLYVLNWAVVGGLRLRSGWAWRETLRGYAEGLTVRCGDRRPMSWHTVARMARAGHPPDHLVAAFADGARRAWVTWAIEQVEADANRSADTHLLVFPLPDEWGIRLYLKDESVHPTGSLKHRLARSLVLYGLCNSWIHEGTTLVEASSGSTAVSEAYFARLLGLPFIAVMPSTTVQEKCELIGFYGGRCHLVDDPGSIYSVAADLAEACGGHFLDQFTYAERATDWRGNNNIAESMFSQLELEPHPVPAWVVVGAGTGGTSATIGRYLRLQKFDTQLCVVDPEGSAFYRSWITGDPAVTGRGSRIEGIGRPRVEPSFVPSLVDRMAEVPDAASVAAMRWTSERLGRLVGGSTGTNIWGALTLVAEMLAEGRTGSVVTLLCDTGARYAHTYYDDSWVARQGWDLEPHRATLDQLLTSGRWAG